MFIKIGEHTANSIEFGTSEFH